MKNYFAVIGDIKDSKKIIERVEIQERLAAILEDINSKYKDEISSAFLITLGDEFQGLLENGKELLTIINEIKQRMYPVRLRFGVGIGEITTTINYKAAIGSDGPAYYAAREMIEFLRKEEFRNKKAAADIAVSHYNHQNVSLNLINSTLQSVKLIENNWTEDSREAIVDAMRYNDGQTASAKRLSIDQSSVSKRLQRGNYSVYMNLLASLKGSIEAIGDEER